MKIYTNITWHWDEILKKYVLDFEDSFLYDGEVALLCGATAAQTAAQTAQASAYTQMTQQASQIFGADSGVFQQLQATFAPTIAAGPDQQGFSPTELSNLNSQAITQSGQAYRNAAQAVGEAESAQGGGNTPGTSSGTKTGTDLGVAEAAAANTSNELAGITAANYQTGRQNYDTAVTGLQNATGVFNSSTQAGEAATQAGSASASTANQIATQNNSWVQAVTGALGGIAGAATGGIIKNLGSGVSTAGDSTNDIIAPGSNVGID